MADAFNPGMIADPDSYFAAQKQQMLAQMLMQNMGRATQTPENWNGMRLVPKMSPLSALTGVVSGYLGGKAYDKALHSQMQNAMAVRRAQADALSTDDQPQASPQPQAAPQEPDRGFMGASSPAGMFSGAGQSSPAGIGSQTGLSSSPLVDALMSQRQQQAPASPPQAVPQNNQRYMKGLQQSWYGIPSDITKQYLADTAPTNEVKNALATAGGDPNLALQILRKPTYGARIGAPNVDFKGNITGYMGDLAQGIQMTQGPNGPEASSIPNAQGLIAALAGRKEAEQQSNTIGESPAAGGGIQHGWKGNLFGLPPSLAGNAPPPQAPAPTPPPTGSPRPRTAVGTPGQQSAPDFSDAVKLPPIGGKNVTPGLLDVGKAASITAADKEQSEKYSAAADAADKRIAFNNEALRVLSGAETGPLSEKLTAFRAKAIELGIPTKWIPGAETVANTQELAKYALRNPLLNLKPYFGARASTNEFDILANKGSPSPLMIQAAYRRLAELDNLDAGFAKTQNDVYQQYTQKGYDPRKFTSWFNNHYPYAKALGSTDTKPRAPVTLNPTDKAAFDALDTGATYTVPGDPTVYTKGKRK